MIEKEIDNKWILPSLTFMIQHKPEMLQSYADDLFHFSSKMINTLNSSTPICVKPNNPQKHLPYVSLSTMGVELYELDYNANAANVAPIKLIKAFYKGEAEFLEMLQTTISLKLEDNEKLYKSMSDMSSEKEISKTMELINKNNVTIEFCEKDKLNIDLINDHIGENSEFYKKIFNKDPSKLLKIPALARQILVFDEEIEQHISLTPIFSLILSKKMKEELDKLKEQDENFKYRRADCNIGGANVQNVTTFNRDTSFRMLMPMPRMKDFKFKKLWKLVLGGFYFKINKNNLNQICETLRVYNLKKTVLNKNILEAEIRKVVLENIKTANELTYFIKSAIKEELVWENERNNLNIDNIDFNSNSFLENVINQPDISKNIFNGILKEMSKDGNVKQKWLLDNKKDYADEISSSVANVFKSKLLFRKVSVSSEIEKIITDIARKEIEK